MVETGTTMAAETTLKLKQAKLVLDKAVDYDLLAKSNLSFNYSIVIN